MGTSIMQKVGAAKRAVPAISPEELQQIMGNDDVLVVDVRDAPEVAASGGTVAGAINVSRGMLEFRADESTPYHNPAFSKDKTIVLLCASGGRAALCGQALQELGYSDVRLLGGFADWQKAGGPVSEPG